MSSSIRNKTIRPGSLNGYSYYHSGQNNNQKTEPVSKPGEKSHKKLILISLAIILAGFWLGNRGDGNKSSVSSNASSATSAQTQSQAVATNNCAGNELDKLIKISVDKRKMWACEKTRSVYSAPVITGLKNHPETETPLGTYKIYGKTTNTTLKGSDSRGAWSDPVYYWIPFLDNQYGTYGFHDATWRANSDFGRISPDSDKASHGCIELPLAASKWLYDWAAVGTTVTVES